MSYDWNTYSRSKPSYGHIFNRVGSGITVISKTSVVDTPTLTNEKSINIPLVPWSSFIFLCIDSL